MRTSPAPMRLYALLAVSLSLLLGACGGEQEELQGWMDQQRREVKPNIAPLSAPTRFDPQGYEQTRAVEPFSNQKLAVALKQEQRQPNSLLAGEMNRRKQPLEAYPLDSMSMVGSVGRRGGQYALLKVDSLLYQVKVGDYLGQNYGKITKISETEIGLREVVQDAAGEWIGASFNPATAGEDAMKNAWGKTTMNQWRAPAVALSMFLATASAWAQNAIQSINSTQQGAADVVRVELSETLAAVPAGFAVQTPPRIAIDLPGVGNAMGRSNIEMNQGNLRSVSVAQAGDRTRLVLNLKQPGNYSAAIEGKTLVLTLQTSANVAAAPVATPAAPAAASPAAVTAPPVRFADSLNQAPQVLRNVDFRRGQDGAGRVIVDLPSNQVGVDIRQQGQSLVVEFLKSNLPEALRRRLDVTDFGTPVRTVSTFQSGDKVRMVVEPTGVWEHSAYQTDNQFVLEVRPQKVDPNKLTQGPGYSGEKLSLNFQSIEVRALLQVIADFTNFNVVTSDTVTGNVTLRLKDVPWDQALDIILQSKGLGVRKNGNVLWIAPKDEIATKEKLELEAKAQIAALEPLRTQAFQLNYVKAEEISKGLTGQQAGGGGGGGGSNNTRILSSRGSVVYETRTNQLFISDTPSKLEEISQIIARIDIPVRQVLIEARIVEATDTFGRSLGVKFGASDLRAQQGGVPGFSLGGSNRAALAGSYYGVGSTTLQPGATAIGGTTTANGTPNSYFVNLPSIGQNGYDAASFAVSLFSSTANRFLNLEISALEADGKGKIVSSPRVITADQVKALIEQGTEIPYQTATSSGATAIQFRKATLKLEVTPQITPEGNIILDVDVNKDSPGATTAAGILINTKHVKTQVLVDNGGTVVIGGIFEQTDQEDVTKVPFLGDVPILGALFRTKTRTSNKTELLVFLTPKVVQDRSNASLR